MEVRKTQNPYVKPGGICTTKPHQTLSTAVACVKFLQWQHRLGTQYTKHVSACGD
jgi:hypothetical protein